MAMQDVRQQLTALLNLRRQRKEAHLDRMFGAGAQVADALFRSGEANRQRDFLAGESKQKRQHEILEGLQEREHDTEQSRLGRAHDLDLENQGAKNDYDLFLKKMGVDKGIDATPDEIAAQLADNRGFQIRLATAGRAQQNIGMGDESFAHLNSAAQETYLGREADYAEFLRDGGTPDEWVNRLMLDVETGFAQRTNRPMTDDEREAAMSMVKRAFGIKDTPGKMTAPGARRGEGDGVYRPGKGDFVGGRFPILNQQGEQIGVGRSFGEPIDMSPGAAAQRFVGAAQNLLASGGRGGYSPTDDLRAAASERGSVADNTVADDTPVSLDDDQLEVLGLLLVSSLSEEERDLVDRALFNGKATQAEIDAIEEMATRRLDARGTASRFKFVPTRN